MTSSVSSSFSMHTAAQVILVLTSLAVGFKLGLSSPPPPPVIDLPPPESEILQASSADGACINEELEPDLEVLEEVSDGDLAAIEPKVWEPCKLVLVVRADLKMSPADISTQCADATLRCYKALQLKNPLLVRHWEITGQAKIALKGTSEEQLLELEAIAKSLNLCARAVHNESLTKDPEGTRTVLGIGPAPVDLINKVTGKLRLL